MLVVANKAADKVAGEHERLLPFIEPVIRKVDLAGGVIVVEWEADY